MCRIALDILSPWHVHWHTTIVIAFLFLILLYLGCCGVSLVAGPLRFILICSCSRKLYLRLGSLTIIPTRLGYWSQTILSPSNATHEVCTFQAKQHAKAFQTQASLRSHWSSSRIGSCSPTSPAKPESHFRRPSSPVSLHCSDSFTSRVRRTRSRRYTQQPSRRWTVHILYPWYQWKRNVTQWRRKWQLSQGQVLIEQASPGSLFPVKLSRLGLELALSSKQKFGLTSTSILGAYCLWHPVPNATPYL